MTTPALFTLSGYEQGILYCTSTTASDCGNKKRVVVRCVTRHFCETIAKGRGLAVQETTTGLNQGTESYKVASYRLPTVALSDVTDATGFLRAVFELRACITKIMVKDRKRRNGQYLRTSLRVYGDEALMDYINLHMPPRKVQTIITNNGKTHALFWQSARIVNEIIGSLRGDPHCPAVWEKWDTVLTDGNHGANKK